MKVSVIGTGTAGMIFAQALLKSGKGYDLTVYTDRTANDWLTKVPPTGTAALYAETIDVERQYGLDHWSDNMHEFHGALLDFKPEIDGPAHFCMPGRFGARPGGAIDMRMRVARWMDDFEADGGKIVVEAVSPERLDQIAAQSDLTVLAAGKADLGNVIPRDPARSIYDKPQRHLAMVLVDGVPAGHWDDRADFNPVKFNFYGDTGEYFWVPFTHMSGRHNWCVLFEAKPGKKMDLFRNCNSAQDVIDACLPFIKEHAPWEYDIVKNMVPAEGDPNPWLKGAFPPTVREAYGVLPSGGLVMPIGDTAITFDPIGGQGGNCAQRNARFAAEAVLARGDQPFDKAWMSQVRDGFWEAHGRAAYTWNNILLEPLTDAGKVALMTGIKVREFADTDFVGNFTRPNSFFPWIEDVNLTQERVAPYLQRAA